ncbi:MAG: 2Fe-2S iron-sulfur cluster binding domain-containing protein [Rhodospirillales bacterium]|nr:2Fe-2S iron-sulfur cluster binding domain-containing protein [Alphaproteobacteria bacterium]USO04350.1 MAG: 2Fe-2S iron-sulfur cluster binding domain-containing protein [Rhodospirillales bacterium]
MPKITMIMKDGAEKIIEAPAGLSLMEIAVKNGIEAIEGACGGSLACATCHLYVHPDWWDRCLGEEDEKSEEEEDMLDLAFDIRKKSRLGCQIMVTEDMDGLIVAMPGAKVDWA